MTAAARAQETARALGIRRKLGLTRPPRKQLPAQQSPKNLMREYAARLNAIAVRLAGAFDDLKSELPRLLEGAARDRHADARMDAGEGKRVRDLIAQARAKMATMIAPGEVEALAAEFARKTSTFQRTQLTKQTRAALGADMFISDRRIGPLMQAFVDSNVGLIKGLSDRMATDIESATLTAVQTAKPWSEFSEEIQKKLDVSETRATTIARDQIGKFYGQANSARQRELGITHFIWRTSNDERVRDEHEALDGQRFAYSDPPSEGLPGEPILCRCSAEPDFSGILGSVDD